MPAWCAPRGACAYSEGLGVRGGAGGGGRGPCSGGGATCGLSYAFIGLQGCELDASDCPRVEICPLVSGTLQKAHASSEVVRKGSASIITVTTVPALLSAAEWEAFLDDLQQTLDKFAVPEAEQAEIKAIIGSTRRC